MFVFIDESGDTGFQFEKGSSEYFVMAAAVFETEADLVQTKHSIEALRLQQGFPAHFEFHYNGSRTRVRESFSHSLRASRFVWYSVVIDKRSIMSDAIKKSAILIAKVVQLLLDSFCDVLGNSTIVLDRRDSKLFYTVLKKQLKQLYNTPGNQKIKEVRCKDSHQESSLQIADYCAAITMRRIKGKSDGIELFDQFFGVKCGGIKIWPTKK
jgi:hypothetical protein